MKLHFDVTGKTQPDPFIFRDDDGKFYIYNTGIDGIHAYSSDSLTGEWHYEGIILTMPRGDQYWAPSMIKYDGKYYIVDWKTNYLGSLFADYGAEKLRDTMMSSGYVLQYHLYAAALCLRMKQNPAFDYDAFGGVYYLFPRGMGEGENGIWYDRPPRECINELVKLFTGEEL